MSSAPASHVTRAVRPLDADTDVPLETPDRAPLPAAASPLEQETTAMANGAASEASVAEAETRTAEETAAPASAEAAVAAAESIAASLDEGELKEQLEVARDFVELGKLDRAAAKVERILEAAPDSVPALEMLADIRMAQGKTADALTLWEKAMQMGGGSPVEVMLKMAQALEAAGDIDKARETYMKALDLEDSNREVVHQLCRLAGVENDSMAFVQKLLKERPSHLALTLKLGHVYRQKAKFSLAVVQYNKALRLKEDAHTFAALARSYDKLGKRDSSVKAWENATRMDTDRYLPNYRRSLEELVAEGDVESARTSVEGFLEANKVSDTIRQQLQDSLNPDLPPRTEPPPEEDESRHAMAGHGGA